MQCRSRLCEFVFSQIWRKWPEKRLTLTDTTLMPHMTTSVWRSMTSGADTEVANRKDYKSSMILNFSLSSLVFSPSVKVNKDIAHTVKPVLKNTCLKRPPAGEDHILSVQLIKEQIHLPLMTNFFPEWSLKTGMTVHRPGSDIPGSDTSPVNYRLLTSAYILTILIKVWFHECT